VTVVELEPASAFRALRAARLPQPRVITVQDIDIARTYVASTVSRWQGDEGPRWRLTIAPNVARLGRVNYTRREKTEEEARMRAYNGDMTVAPDRAKRSTISKWSRESRTRMGYVLKTLDCSPLFDNHGIPALVTLTMPRNWEQIAPTPKSFKNLLENLRKRYTYAWGHTMTGVWKLEFQARGAPHLHILMTPPTHRKPGTGESFSSWLAVTWAQICQLPNIDWDDEEQRRMRIDHELMGTHIDYSKGLQGHSPDMVAAYFSKHGLFGAKDYQNDPPQLWRDAVKHSGGVRFWGYWALKKATGIIELNPITPHYVKSPAGAPKTEDQLVRHLFKAKSRQASYVRKTTVYRNKVDYQTGEIVTRKRRVNRRTKWMNGQAGYISLKDGEAFAYEVARLLAWHAAQTTPRAPAQPRYDSNGLVASTQ